MQAKKGGNSISDVQMDQVKGVVREHLEKHKFFDSPKSAVAKDPKLNKLDRNQIIEKLRSEGVLNDIINSIPVQKKSQGATAAGGLTSSASISGSGNLPQVAPSKRKAMLRADLDPNKRYMSCSVIKGSAFADFVNTRPDEHISVTVSFLKNRFHTKMVPASTDPVFDETFLFEFVGDNE